MNRIHITSALVALALTTSLAVGPAATARTTHRHPAAKRTVSVTCQSSLQDQIDSTGVPVSTSAPSGSQYGPVQCSQLFSPGVEATTFTTDDSGDMTGTFRDYFDAGTLRGTYALTQDDSGDQPSTDNFTTVSYAGTVTIAGGTGVERGTSGTGTLSCTSQDGLHLSCTEHLKLNR